MEHLLTPVLRRQLYPLVFFPTFPAKVNVAFIFLGRERRQKCSGRKEEGFVFSDLYSILENLCSLV